MITLYLSLQGITRRYYRTDKCMLRSRTHFCLVCRCALLHFIELGCFFFGDHDNLVCCVIRLKNAEMFKFMF